MFTSDINECTLCPKKCAPPPSKVQ